MPISWVFMWNGEPTAPIEYIFHFWQFRVSPIPPSIFLYICNTLSQFQKEILYSKISHSSAVCKKLKNVWRILIFSNLLVKVFHKLQIHWMKTWVVFESISGKIKESLQIQVSRMLLCISMIPRLRCWKKIQFCSYIDWNTLPVFYTAISGIKVSRQTWPLLSKTEIHFSVRNPKMKIE